MQGREHEWLFATAEGQWAVAADCMSKRVILVVLNRGHTFKGTAAVNKELSPLVRCMSLHASSVLHTTLSLWSISDDKRHRERMIKFMACAAAGAGSGPSTCPDTGEENSHFDHKRGDWREGCFGGGRVCYKWVRRIQTYFIWHEIGCQSSEAQLNGGNTCQTCNVRI